MNTIELKQKEISGKTPLEIFDEAAIGQAFRVKESDVETIGMKCYAKLVDVLVDVRDGHTYHETGMTNTSFTDGKISIIPIDIKITEL
jgi:hypothetical protein